MRLSYQQIKVNRVLCFIINIPHLNVSDLFPLQSSQPITVFSSTILILDQSMSSETVCQSDVISATCVFMSNTVSFMLI